MKRAPSGGCAVHHMHVPKVFDADVHHVWPVGEGGPDAAENRVTICPTGHRNVHELIRLYLRNEAPSPVVEFFSPQEQELAARGYAAILRHRRQQESP